MSVVLSAFISTGSLNFVALDGCFVVRVSTKRGRMPVRGTMGDETEQMTLGAAQKDKQANRESKVFFKLFLFNCRNDSLHFYYKHPL